MTRAHDDAAANEGIAASWEMGQELVRIPRSLNRVPRREECPRASGHADVCNGVLLDPGLRTGVHVRPSSWRIKEDKLVSEFTDRGWIGSVPPRGSGWVTWQVSIDQGPTRYREVVLTRFQL